MCCIRVMADSFRVCELFFFWPLIWDKYKKNWDRTRGYFPKTLQFPGSQRCINGKQHPIASGNSNDYNDQWGLSLTLMRNIGLWQRNPWILKWFSAIKNEKKNCLFSSGGQVSPLPALQQCDCSCTGKPPILKICDPPSSNFLPPQFHSKPTFTFTVFTHYNI